jgi:hypothetical protein
MKKRVLAFALIAAIVLGISFAAAQDYTSLPPAGILPDNPLYGFKTFFERLQLFFTFGHEGKAKLHLKFAEQRLSELNQSIAENKSQNVQSLEKDYEDELQGASQETNNTQALGRNATALTEHVAGMTFKHILVLENLLNKVPDQARAHIENAINKSQNGHDQAVRSILENRNVTGLVNITFTVENQTFTQTFNITSERGGKKIEENIHEEENTGKNESANATETTNITSNITSEGVGTCNCPNGFEPSSNNKFCRAKNGRMIITDCQ